MRVKRSVLGKKEPISYFLIRQTDEGFICIRTSRSSPPNHYAHPTERPFAAANLIMQDSDGAACGGSISVQLTNQMAPGPLLPPRIN